MNERSDPEQLLRLWFSDGPATMPDRVVSIVADRIARQRQRRRWRLPSRRFPMRPMHLAAGAAAVLAIAIAGWALLPQLSNVGGPLPTATPTLSPSRATATQVLPNGPLAAGTYSLRPVASSALSIEATVPARWQGFDAQAILGPNGTGSPGGIGVAFLAPDGVFSDGCHWDHAGTGRWPQPGDLHLDDAPGRPTARGLANTLYYQFNGNGGLDADVALGGFSGRKIDIHLPTDIDFAKACDHTLGHTDGAYFVFGSSEPASLGLYAQGPGQVWHVWLLDVGQAPIAVVIAEYPTTPAADRAAARSIVDSIVIRP
jgi:hypothetical protein